MHFEFEKLDVYQASLDFVVHADEIAEKLPRGRSYLRDQLRRAASSIPSNIAEGVGEFAPKEKARFYRIARRSAVECASHLLVCRKLRIAEEPALGSALELLHRVVAMLTAMARNVEARDPSEDRQRQR
jgi:four helix bundle protein